MTSVNRHCTISIITPEVTGKNGSHNAINFSIRKCYGFFLLLSNILRFGCLKIVFCDYFNAAIILCQIAKVDSTVLLLLDCACTFYTETLAPFVVVYFLIALVNLKYVYAVY